MKFLKILILIITPALFILQAEAQDDKITGGILDKQVNSGYEDYGAYLIFGTDNDTLFFTSSRPVEKRRKIAMTAEIFYSTRPAMLRNTNTPINEGWSKAEKIKLEESRIAEFTRGSQTIHDDRIIFAAERDLSTETAEGTSFLFDLWQMTKRADGFSLPEPLLNVNDVDAWDSQPALSQDGKVLFFVSNRAGGKGGLDIWYSVRKPDGRWGTPKNAENINTEGDEFSPHAGADGNFYFSTNWDYEAGEKSDRGKDIYRADYVNAAGVQVPAHPVDLDKAIAEDANKYGLTIPGNIKYNSDKDDEFPFITPDRKGIFITSNRGGGLGKRDLYAFKLPQSKIRLMVNVSEEIYDENGNLIVPETEKKGLPLILKNKNTGAEREITSGVEYEVEPESTYEIHFSKFVEEECYQNKIEGGDVMKLETKRPFGLDTLYIRDALVTRRKIDIPPVIFHSTDTLPYFITGYWYPNTSENLKKFRKREASGFFDKTGFVDSTGYNYGKIAHKIDSVFDRRIYKPLEEMLPLFQDFCRDTLYLKVTVHGYTDPRGLSAGNEHPYRPGSRYQRVYMDSTITVGVDANGNPLVIPKGIDMFKRAWTVETKGGGERRVSLPNDGEEGNVLLSKMRAYYTFKTFDEAMQERSPIYQHMRNNNRVILDAEGFGIDKEGFKERNLRDDPQSRRIEIYLDVLRPNEIATHKRLKGGKLLITEKGIVEADDLSVEPEEEETPPESGEPETDVIDIEDENETEEDLDTSRGITETMPNRDMDVDDSQDIASLVTSDPLPPAQDNPMVQPESNKGCYSLQFATYNNLQNAEEGLETLKSFELDQARIVEYIDPFGNRSYRLRSGCYDTADEAIKSIGGMQPVAKALGLKTKPLIVR